MTTTIQLDIQGMSCATCSQAITDALRELDGTEDVSVNYATDEGAVEYDPDSVSLKKIYETIDSTGITRSVNLLRSGYGCVSRAPETNTYSTKTAVAPPVCSRVRGRCHIIRRTDNPESY